MQKATVASVSFLKPPSIGIVRFLFETDDANAGRFKYVQFSDHNIAPTKAAHFHIFFGGDSQESLFNEMDNWPTYYPSDLSKQEIAQEMIAH